ncbi:MAG: hypothetical protein EA427_03405 [Spirochaetaceae bacterium]|nr:MAG: hypothetical protein EA427_03405 [Spirochaetaceae bacterium]
MAIRQLRNHIPIGGPARREPVDGTETAMRLSLGFEPAWFVNRCGVDLGTSWHVDPRVRYRALTAMKAELLQSFPEVPCWREDDPRDLATISGVYGAYPVPHLFGIALRYYPDKWPELDPERRLSVKEIEALQVDRVLSSPVAEALFEQMEVIEREWGPVHGYLNWQGVLNNAFNIRGQEIFMDMYERPAFVHAFLDLIAQVLIRFAKRLQERQRRSGFEIDQLSVSNCVVNMISPEDYRTFVKPRDERIAREFGRFGVHTCNWDITPYIDALAELPHLGYLDMGMMSDLPRVKAAFPDTRRAVMYSPWTLHQTTIGEIRRDMEKIRAELAPCDVVMADIQADTPDDRVRDLLRICRELERA